MLEIDRDPAALQDAARGTRPSGDDEHGSGVGRALHSASIVMNRVIVLRCSERADIALNSRGAERFL